MSDKKQPLKYQQLKEMVNSLSHEQLAMPVIWWGDERGGSVVSAEPLDEDYILSDEGYEPRSVFTEDEIEEYGMSNSPILPKGTIILSVD